MNFYVQKRTSKKTNKEYYALFYMVGDSPSLDDVCVCFLTKKQFDLCKSSVI